MGFSIGRYESAGTLQIQDILVLSIVPVQKVIEVGSLHGTHLALESFRQEWHFVLSVPAANAAANQIPSAGAENVCLFIDIVLERTNVCRLNALAQQERIGTIIVSRQWLI